MLKITILLLAVVSSAFASFPNVDTPYELEENKIAFYPGSFDPPTRSHLSTVKSLIEDYGFDKIYVVINTRGPKNYMTSLSERKEMMRAGLREIVNKEIFNKIVFVDEPIDGKEPLKKRLQQKENLVIYGVTGTDGWETLPEEAKNDLLKKWIIMPRPELGDVVIPKRSNILEITPTGMGGGTSSSFIRKELGQGRVPLGPLFKSVYNIIKSNNWYTLKTDQDYLFNKEWDDYLRNYPQFSDIEPPQYKEGQTRRAWRENFVRVSVASMKTTFSKKRAFLLESKGWVEESISKTCFSALRIFTRM